VDVLPSGVERMLSQEANYVSSEAALGFLQLLDWHLCSNSRLFQSFHLAFSFGISDETRPSRSTFVRDIYEIVYSAPLGLVIPISIIRYGSRFCSMSDYVHGQNVS